jgi:hypothetical protein
MTIGPPAKARSLQSTAQVNESKAVRGMSTERTTTGRTTGWLGVDLFAGAIILLSGLFSGFEGLVALIGPSFYYTATSGSLFILNVDGWAWWNLIVGIIFVITGISLLAGQAWARVVSIILAIISAVTQLFLIPVQPWWAIIVIAVDILVIYALTVHGRELRED